MEVDLLIGIELLIAYIMRAIAASSPEPIPKNSVTAPDVLPDVPPGVTTTIDGSLTETVTAAVMLDAIADVLASEASSVWMEDAKLAVLIVPEATAVSIAVLAAAAAAVGTTVLRTVSTVADPT
jgi:hypothetical protein